MKIKIKETGEIREVIKEKDGKVCIAKTPSWFTWLNEGEYEVVEDSKEKLFEAIGETCEFKKYPFGNTDSFGHFTVEGYRYHRGGMTLQHLLRTAYSKKKYFSIQTNGDFIYTFSDGWERLKRGEDDCVGGQFDLTKSLSEQSDEVLNKLAEIIL